MVRPIAMPALEPLPLCEECRERRQLALAGGARSRHVADVMEPNSRSRGGGYQVCSSPPQWRLAAVLALVAAACLLLGLPNLSYVLLAVAARLGPMHLMLTLLPEVHSRADFDNRQYRVQQSLWLVSICCSAYTFIPEEVAAAGLTGWKMNLVTMETSMASGIAATYGYSVAGGVPGGLLAEYVMSWLGKRTVAEISPYLGAQLGKAVVSFVLFMCMGSYMELFAISAYAFAHQASRMHAAEMEDVVNRSRATSMPNAQVPAAGVGVATMAAAVRALPDFSDSLPDDYRKGYGAWRSGKSHGARGEPSSVRRDADELDLASRPFSNAVTVPAHVPAANPGACKKRD